MVGNDVVDLGDREVQGGPSHPRFDARVFSASERALLRRSARPELLRWTLWAAKEAAFKLARKRDPRVVFSPRRFVVALEGPDRAVVCHTGLRLAVRIAAAGHALHALALEADPPGERLVWAVEPRRRADPSRAARRLAARVLAEELGLPAAAFRFGRRGRAPTLAVEGGATRFDLSLSHHGRYVAFACQMGGST
jgi:phosphopantetheinyl transferase (holo-ACP synthase)